MQLGHSEGLYSVAWMWQGMARHSEGVPHLNGGLGSGAGGKASHAICEDRVGEEEGEPLVASGPQLLQGQHGQHKVLIVQERVCTGTAHKFRKWSAQKQHRTHHSRLSRNVVTAALALQQDCGNFDLYRHSTKDIEQHSDPCKRHT